MTDARGPYVWRVRCATCETNILADTDEETARKRYAEDVAGEGDLDSAHDIQILRMPLGSWELVQSSRGSDHA